MECSFLVILSMRTKKKWKKNIRAQPLGTKKKFVHSPKAKSVSKGKPFCMIDM